MPKDDKPLSASFAELVQPQLEEVSRHKPVRARRQVLDIRPITDQPQVQELASSGDKDSEGEHNVSPTSKESTIMSQTIPQSFGFGVNPAGSVQPQQSAEDQKAAFMKAQEDAWNHAFQENQKRKEFLNSISDTAQKHDFISKSDLPSRVKDRLYRAEGYEAEDSVGMKIVKTFGVAAAASVSAAVVVASSIFILEATGVINRTVVVPTSGV